MISFYGTDLVVFYRFNVSYEGEPSFYLIDSHIDYVTMYSNNIVSAEMEGGRGYLLLNNDHQEYVVSLLIVTLSGPKYKVS